METEGLRDGIILHSADIWANLQEVQVQAGMGEGYGWRLSPETALKLPLRSRYKRVLLRSFFHSLCQKTRGKEKKGFSGMWGTWWYPEGAVWTPPALDWIWSSSAL